MKNPDRRQASSGFGQLELPPNPDFNPPLPLKGTLPEKALKLLVCKQYIDREEFYEATGSRQLDAAVIALCAIGWPVESIKYRSDSGKRICFYYLSSAALEYLWRRLYG